MPVVDIEYASLGERDDFDIVFGAVVHKGSSLQWASHALKNDSGIVIAAVQNDGMALRFAPQFQNDQSIVLAAVSQNGRSLQFASEVVRNLLPFPMVEFLPLIVPVYSQGLQDERIVVLLAVVSEQTEESHDATWALQFASKRLRNDMAVVLAAVTKYGMCLEYASLEMRANREIVLVSPVWYAAFSQFGTLQSEMVKRLSGISSAA